MASKYTSVPCISSIFRFGIGRFTTEEEIDYTVERTVKHVKRLREMRFEEFFFHHHPLVNDFGFFTTLFMK